MPAWPGAAMPFPPPASAPCWPPPGEAGVPVRLLSDTVRTALWFTSEEAGIAGVVSTRAVAWPKERSGRCSCTN